MDGKGIWYYENGRIWKEDNFKDGKIDGKWTFYNVDGSIKEVVEYKQGKLYKIPNPSEDDMIIKLVNDSK